MPKYEISEWVPRWVKEHCIVEADTEEEATEKYEDGDILDCLPDRDEIGDRVGHWDKDGFEICEVPADQHPHIAHTYAPGTAGHVLNSLHVALQEAQRGASLEDALSAVGWTLDDAFSAIEAVRDNT